MITESAFQFSVPVMLEKFQRSLAWEAIQSNMAYACVEVDETLFLNVACRYEGFPCVGGE